MDEEWPGCPDEIDAEGAADPDSEEEWDVAVESEKLECQARFTLVVEGSAEEAESHIACLFSI